MQWQKEHQRCRHKMRLFEAALTAASFLLPLILMFRISWNMAAKWIFSFHAVFRNFSTPKVLAYKFGIGSIFQLALSFWVYLNFWPCKLEIHCHRYRIIYIQQQKGLTHIHFSWWFFLWCEFNWLLILNVSLQDLHLLVRSSVCRVWCLAKSLLVTNLFWQCVQWNCLSSWIFICAFMSAFLLNALLQVLQENVSLLPRWKSLVCMFRQSLRVKALSQSEQGNGFSPVWTTWCLFKWPLVEKLLSQCWQKCLFFTEGYMLCEWT